MSNRQRTVCSQSFTRLASVAAALQAAGLTDLAGEVAALSASVATGEVIRPHAVLAATAA